MHTRPIVALGSMATLALGTLLAACGGSSPAPGGKRQAAAARCLDPRDFGAIVDDGSDDRAALQATIDAAVAQRLPVCLPPGDLNIAHHPDSGRAGIGSLQIRGVDGFTMTGAGAKSRLVMTGAAILPGASIPSNWWLIEIQANDVRLADFALDAGQRADTVEQTHLVQILGPSRGVRLEGLTMSMQILDPPEGSVRCKAPRGSPETATRMCEHGGAQVLCASLVDSPFCEAETGTDGETVYRVIGWYGGGDCIRTLGEAGGHVSGVSVTDIQAPVCDRSFFGFQRFTDNVVIANNDIEEVRDQVIDQEPSGGGIRNVWIVGNRLHRGPRAQGQAAVTIAGCGDGDLLATGVVVQSNDIDGGVHVYNAAHSSILFNRIHGLSGLPDSVIMVHMYGDGVRIIGNTIERPAGAAGSAITVSHHRTGAPTGTVIALNDIRQRSDGVAIMLQSVQGARVIGNRIDCAQPTPSTYDVITARGIIAPIAGLRVEGNVVEGRCNRLLRVGQYASVPIGSIEVVGNDATGLSAGVEFDKATPDVEPVVDDNQLELGTADNYVTPKTLRFDGRNGLRDRRPDVPVVRDHRTKERR